MSGTTIDQPVLLALLRYWNKKRGAAALPARPDIDPLEMGPPLLPSLMLADLLDRGTRVRFRLVGTAVTKRLGFDPTGKYLEDTVKGGFGEQFAALSRLVYADRAPLYSEIVLHWGGHRRLEIEQLLLPLSQGGPDPAIALIGMSFRSLEPFPPSLGALAEIAAAGELRRFVPKLTGGSDWDADAGRSVA
jgi:hypothetical protein